MNILLIPINIKDELKIKLRRINNIINMSFIFYEYTILLSIPDIWEWNSSNTILMGGIFTNLSSLSLISK